MADHDHDHDLLTINTIRTLSMDAVQRANSGHPGAPMGLAPCAYTLWTRHLSYDPKAPDWPNRDRFVLSNGHASMLLYSLLHLAGFEAMTLDEIKNFRQLHSLTPGHPEAELTPGVEVTTGPLGQGFATSVGLAIAEAQLHARYDEVIDHHTYVICSDGDLMEGVSHEAASLAGHLGLGKLIVLYDDNQITIDGGTGISFTEDVAQRFEAYGWHVSSVSDGNDVEAIDAAIAEAKAEGDKPSLISVRTVIGYGSPNKANSSSSHGAPLGEDEIALTKKVLGWEHTEPFYVPEQAYTAFEEPTSRGEAAHQQWHARLKLFAEEHPARGAELERRLAGEFPAGWSENLPTFKADEKGMATRKASGSIIKELYASLPELTGGSADLAGSNKTLHEEFGIFAKGHRDGQNLHFGVREFAMAAAANGMNLHGGVRGFGATFLVFSDYMRPALRLAALMHQPQLMVFTHDSIGLGEDGPTHQPIEHVMSLRAMPNYWVFRPADANEVRECWVAALERTGGPSGLVLTRQGVPTLDREALGAKGDASRGGYIVADAPDPQAILMGTGSEVSILVDAYKALAKQGVSTRVVSLPCWELFAEQDAQWRHEVLPPEITARVSLEAGVTLGWERWIGSEGHAIGLDHFGASAPYEDVYEEFGLTAEAVVAATQTLLGD